MLGIPARSHLTLLAILHFVVILRLTAGLRTPMEGQKANKQTVMSRGYWRSRRSSSAGFTLLEMLLTIGIVSLLLIVVVSVSNIANLQRNSNNQAIARQL